MTNKEEPLYDIKPSPTMAGCSPDGPETCLKAYGETVVNGAVVPLCSASTGMPCTKAVRAAVPEALDEIAGAGAGAFRGGARRGVAWASSGTDRPFIGLVAKQFPEERFLSLPADYAPAVAAAGGIPVILPFMDDVDAYAALFEHLDGFVLTGGHDVDPALYGGPFPGDDAFASVSQLTPDRDALEFEILNFADAHDIPVLGICRGMQLINVYYGGTLHVDLPTDLGLPREQHWQTAAPAQPVHAVRIGPGTRLGAVMGDGEFSVNSLHHQAVRDVAPALRPCAWADGLVEGVEHPDRAFMLGVQWHPEFFAGEGPMGPLFGALVDAARTVRAAR